MAAEVSARVHQQSTKSSPDLSNLFVVLTVSSMTVHDMVVERNFVPTAEVNRLGPVCCCHGQNINNHSTVNGSSLAPVVAAANVEVKSVAGAPQWPTEAVNIMKNAGVRKIA